MMKASFPGVAVSEMDYDVGGAGEGSVFRFEDAKFLVPARL